MQEESTEEIAAEIEESFESSVAPVEEDFIEYAGFWRRVAASLIDTILMVIVLALLAVPLGLMGMPLMMGHSGSFLITDIIPMVIVISFWLKFGATPGKQLLDCQIVDARTGHPLRLGQSILRYLGYILSTIPFFLGFLWIAWSPRKQGFHDYIAGTVVIHKFVRQADPVADKPIEDFIKERR